MLRLHSVFDCIQDPIDFSSGLITVCEGKVHKRISSVYKSRHDYQDHSNHSFHCLIPCLIALHLFLVRLLLNTRLYKAIGACTIVYDTDLQRGRAVTSMFRDVTIEIYACFQSLSIILLLSIYGKTYHVRDVRWKQLPYMVQQLVGWLERRISHRKFEFFDLNITISKWRPFGPFAAC